MEEQNNLQNTLLAVLAHPDDETFGMGGTLAMYAQKGVKVYLVCATRGEVGEVDERFLRGFDTIADRRESELRCAAELLGLAGVFFLGYRDSGMVGSVENKNPQALVAAPLDEVAAAVTHYIRLLRPQVVLTFDPIGGYRHPDHIAIHQATVSAFFAAPNQELFPDPDGLPPYQPQKLYFHTFQNSLIRVFVRLMPLVGRDPHRFGKNQDIDLTQITDVRFPTHAQIDYRPVAELRDQASACHASQGGSQMNSSILGKVRRWIGSRDTYMRAYPPVNDHQVEKNLFSNVAI
jgi:N-acetyl-1-D-myo-inositol-2-amino-2-deoxy-alpha-D-glucopyranoside deacetylase